VERKPPSNVSNEHQPLQLSLSIDRDKKAMFFYLPTACNCSTIIESHPKRIRRETHEYSVIEVNIGW
jgi:hypothetical protein